MVTDCGEAMIGLRLHPPQPRHRCVSRRWLWPCRRQRLRFDQALHLLRSFRGRYRSIELLGEAGSVVRFASYDDGKALELAAIDSVGPTQWRSQSNYRKPPSTPGYLESEPQAHRENRSASPCAGRAATGAPHRLGIPQKPQPGNQAALRAASVRVISLIASRRLGLSRARWLNTVHDVSS
jgi:hypothetical protein